MLQQPRVAMHQKPGIPWIFGSHEPSLPPKKSGI